MKKYIFALAAASVLSNPLVAEEVSASKNFKISQQAAASAAVSLPPVVAKVNGVDIPFTRFWNELISNAGNAVMTSLADEILITQEAEKQFGSASGSKKAKVSQAQKNIDGQVARKISEIKKQFPNEKAFNEQFEKGRLSLDELRKQIRMEIYKFQLLGDKISVNSVEVKKYYDDNKERLSSPERIHLKHILVSTEQEARELMLAIKAGASFDSMAKAKSKDTATKDKGGELGHFARGMLTPEIEQKAFSLEKSGMDVVQSPLGFHIIKLIEKLPPKAAQFDKATQQAIEQALKQAKFNQEYPKYIEGLRSKADIQILLKQ